MPLDIFLDSQAKNLKRTYFCHILGETCKNMDMSIQEAYQECRSLWNMEENIIEE